jgi:hypothetical protein
MSFKQKKRTIKSFIPTLLLILFFASCMTPYHLHYSDPNYLSSNEFSTYEEITANSLQEQELIYADTLIDSNTNYYASDDYYDYSFSSRIRRFHRPMYYSGYYGGIYTDYYWYNNDPFSCGTSIYYGYNWHSPYYSHYSYSPYYSNYYSPYYFGNYYSHNGYGFNHNQHALQNIYYSNSNDHNSYITGRRGSLSSSGGRRGVSVNNNILSKTTKASNLNIRSNKTRGENTIKTRNSISSIKTNNTNRGNSTLKKNQNNSSLKNTKRSNSKNFSNTKIRENSNKKNNSYATPKRNNRSYKSNSGNRRSNNNKSSGSGKRSVKPRK